MKKINKNNLATNLKKLCLQPGISGYEKESGISNFLFQIVKKINPNTKFDLEGNILSEISGSGKTILIEAHMDEVGFLVNETKDKIFLSPQGIVKGERVANNKVFVVSKGINGKIIISKNNNFIFDPIIKSDSDKIKKGDLIAFKRIFIKKNNNIEANSLDNRVGCSVLLELLKYFTKNKVVDNLLFVFSTKEETSQSFFSDSIIKKDCFAIVVDAAYAQPVEFDTTNDGVSIPILGQGCAIQTKGEGFEINKSTIKKTRKLAETNNIKIQEERAPLGLGKTNFAQMLKQGLKSGVVINIPVRNQHNQLSVMNISDANEAVKLIEKLIKNNKELDQDLNL
jgi:tetrahedral aminopeptidase